MKRGDQLESFLTRGEAVEIGLLRSTAAGNRLEPTGARSEDQGAGQPPFMGVPPAIEDIEIGAAVQSVVLSWPNQLLSYRNHGFVEIWRAEVDDLGQAVMVGQARGTMYPDSIGPGQGRYYWLRSISQNDVPGPFNAVAGLYAETGLDVSYTLGVLTDEYGGTSQAPFFQIDEPTVINGVTIQPGTYMKQAYAEAITVTSLMVQDAFLDNLTAAKGTLAQARIQKGNIFDLTIQDRIQSDNYAPGSSGHRIDRDGNVEFNQGTFRGQVQFLPGSGGIENLGGLAAGQNLLSQASAEPGSGSGGFINIQPWLHTEDYRLSPGDKVSFSIEARLSANDGTRYRITVQFRASGVPDTTFSSGSNQVEGTDWVRLDINGAVVPENGPSNFEVRIYLSKQDSTGSATIDYRRPMLVRGAKALPFEEPPIRKSRGEADDYETAASLVTDWRYQGGTLIDGGKLFTGQAYVNTLVVNENAINAITSVFQAGVPSATSPATSGSVFAESKTAWTEVMQATLQTGYLDPNDNLVGGAPVKIEFNSLLRRTDNNNNTEFQVRLYRAPIVGTPEGFSVGSWDAWDQRCEGTQVADHISMSVTDTAVEGKPGAYTYRVFTRLGDGADPGHLVNFFSSNLTVQEAKR